ncbi:polymer-forming cytoskeletal protein [beta proteobacterium MWH-UniP1]
MAIFGSKPEQSSEDLPSDQQGGMSPQSAAPPQRQDVVSSGARDISPSGRDEANRPSVISEGFSFVGEIRGKGPLTVDGATEGVIEVGSLVIGVGGRSEGQISAKSINVKGRLSGTVNCDELVIGGRAEVDGQVTYGSLTIQRGGNVRGELKRK